MTSDDEKRLQPPQRPRSREIKSFCANMIMMFHNFLVTGSAIQRCVYKTVRTGRGGVNLTRPKLPDFILVSQYAK